MTQIPALSKAQWREDLQYLVDQLSDHHLNLYHTITQERFAEAVADLHAAIQLLQDAAIVVELLRLTALIGDGHTSFRSWEVFQRYPLDLFWFGNELRVIRTTSTYARILGTQVVKIGNIDIDGALAAIAGFIQQGENEWFVRQRSPFFLTAVYVCFRGYDSFEENAHNLLKFIAATPTERLIIDLRQNEGGDLTQVRTHLLPALKGHSLINQQGHLFVIIGRQTYSAAMFNATDFRRETKAILVGEPTGARPNGYQKSYRFVLPNSQLSVSCSTRFYRFQDEDTPAVTPDKRIEPSWDAYQAGHDPVLEWIRRQF